MVYNELIGAALLLSFVQCTHGFRAAAVDGNITTGIFVTAREEALIVINKNLKQISSFASTAERLGVDVIVFPEYGITGFMHGNETQRSSVYAYMEEVPAVTPAKPVCGMCNSTRSNTEIQTQVACLAQHLGIYIVANMIESVPCSKSHDSKCPSDNHYQFDTNIIFNGEGCLIAKYHKFHLYDEEVLRLDRPATPEYVYFDTKFGRFGTIICFDSLFAEPGITLVEKFHVNHILFPTSWDMKNDFIALRVVQWLGGLSQRWGVNIIGSNIHDIFKPYIGSGLFTPSGIFRHVSNFKDNSSSLLIDQLGNTSISNPNNSLSRIDPGIQIGSTIKSYKYSVLEFIPVSIYNDSHNATILVGLNGSAKVCHHQLCCLFYYRRNQTSESYILAAFDGMHNFEGKFYQQNCIVHRCVEPTKPNCGEERLNWSSTAFSSFNLSATYDTDYVYPITLPSQLDYEKVSYVFSHDVNRNNHLIGGSEWPMVTFGLIGRVYEKDPPLP